MLAMMSMGLFHMHSNGVTHRDLKPENVLIKNGILKICDFGMAKHQEVATMKASAIKGSFGYLAPEQNQGNVSPKTDIFALGMILFNLLTTQSANSKLHSKELNKLQKKMVK